jgi:hypothetical protein
MAERVKSDLSFWRVKEDTEPEMKEIMKLINNQFLYPN